MTERHHLQMTMALISTCNRERKAIYAHAICVATGKGAFRLAPFNHSAIAFFHCDCLGGFPSDVYYESWLRVNPETGKNGVQGPLPFAKLEQWRDENPSQRTFHIQYLPFSPGVCKKALQFSEGLVGTEYAKLQIWQNATRSFLGLPSLPKLRSKKKMTCSEFAAHVIDHALWCHCIDCHNEPLGTNGPRPMRDWLEIGTRNVFDDISPAGQLGLYEAVQKMAAGRS